MTLPIPASLAESCAKKPERGLWLDDLPRVIQSLASRWSLEIGEPFDGDDLSCSWVSRVRRKNGRDAILKIGMPHMEGEHEIAGLQLLDGEPTVRLFECDERLNAMLIELCEPGTPLSNEFQLDQDIVIAGLLKRFWRTVPAGHPFRPLSTMIRYWMSETTGSEANWHDAPLVRDGLSVFQQLIDTSMGEYLLATDLHAGNVLRSQREPWLVIDPKPFVGDCAYDATQNLMNSRSRLRYDPFDTMRRIADLLEVDYDRVRLWTFARLAAEPRVDWDDEPTALARIIAP